MLNINKNIFFSLCLFLFILVSDFNKSYGQLIEPVSQKIDEAVSLADSKELLQLHDSALNLIKQYRYFEASRILKEIVNSPLAFSKTDSALFWLAECYYRQGENVKALGCYKKLLSAYPFSEFYDRGAYSMGWAHIKDNNPMSAAQTFALVSKKEMPLWLDANLQRARLMVKYQMDNDQTMEVYESLLDSGALKDNERQEAELQIGLGLFKNNMYSSSYVRLKNALKITSKDQMQPVQYYIALCMFRLEKYQTAASEFALTLSYGPDTDLGHRASYYLAWCYIKLSQNDKAEKLLVNEMLNEDSCVRAEAYKTFNELLMNNKEYEKAVRFADKYSGLLNKIDRADVCYTKALALFKIRKYQESIREFTDFILEFPKDSRTEEAAYQIGLVKMEMRKYKEALADFSRVEKYSLDSSLKERAIYRRGECWAYLGNITRAGDVFHKILVQYPHGETRYDALYQIGELAFVDKNYDDALIAFGALAESNSPISEQALYRSGDVLMKAGRWNDAVEMFNKYVKKYPKGSMRDNAYLKCGLSFLELKDDSEALKAFVNLLNSEGDYRQEARFYIAEIARRAGNFAQSIQFYKAIIAESPNHLLAPKAEIGVGAALCEMKDFKNSYLSLKRASQRLPEKFKTYPEATLWIGRSLLGLGKTYEGILELLSLPVKFPNSNLKAEAYCEVGRAFSQIEKYDKAVSMYKEVLKYDPSSDLKEEAELFLLKYKQAPTPFFNKNKNMGQRL